MSKPTKGVARFLKDEVEIKISNANVRVRRKGWRAVFDCTPNATTDLPRIMAGQIPFFYREPDKIAADFKGRHDVFDAIHDLATKAPSSAKFQQSHCGEIFAALYLEDVLGLRMLYSKLSLTTSEDTNVHKMDGFFVDLKSDPITFFAVEAKTSILPTDKSPCRGHRYGIMKKMLESLEGYNADDQRFDFTLIRDNLHNGRFSVSEEQQIRTELKPPGPSRLVHIGIATINESTLCAEDDEYILSEQCALDFSFRSLVVADLAKLAASAYAHVKRLKV